MASVLIALGGNVGDVRATFQKAIANICGMAQAALLARSSDYATPPWGDEAAGPLRQRLHRDRDRPRPARAAVHAARDRGEIRPRPRARDGAGARARSTSICSPMTTSGSTSRGLTLPHPRLFERAFVLVPLAEIAPGPCHCGTPRRRCAGRAFDRRYRAAAGPRLDAAQKGGKTGFGLAAATGNFRPNHSMIRKTG